MPGVFSRNIQWCVEIAEGVRRLHADVLDVNL
jgi:hypothetical protein